MGDAVVVPARVSHRMVGGSEDVPVCGGYSDGRDWDLLRKDRIAEADRRAAVKLIMSLPIPDYDPVTGGPMTEWREAPSSVDWDWNSYREALDPT